MGIIDNATAISNLVISVSSIIKLHLSVEDKILHPALQNGKNSALANMGKKFQEEMRIVASAHLYFGRNWNNASKVSRDPEGFRSKANKVLKILHNRMQNENIEFYPAIEAL